MADRRAPTTTISGMLLAASLLLAGCAMPHAHSLVPREGEPFVAGVIVHRGNTDFLVLETNDERYEGEFRFARVQDWQALQARYRSSPKQWDAIMSGLDRRHVYHQATADLQSPSGSAMTCQLLWRHVDRPSGTCSDAHGRTFEVAFDQPSQGDSR